MKFLIAMPVGPGRGRYLAQAVRSVAAQAGEGVQIGVAAMDACASNETRRAFDAVSHTIVLRREGADQGQAAAIDRAWTEAPGDILHWLNDDDFLMPGVLRRVAGIFADHPEIDVVHGQTAMLDEAGALTGLHHEVQPMSDLIYRANIVAQPSCFVRREAVEAVGGLDPARVYTMDWDLWMRLHAAGRRFHFLPDILSLTLHDANTKTSTGGVRRLMEIHHLVRRHGSALRAAKAVIAFAAHGMRGPDTGDVAVEIRSEDVWQDGAVIALDDGMGRLRADFSGSGRVDLECDGQVVSLGPGEAAPLARKLHNADVVAFRTRAHGDVRGMSVRLC